RAPFTLRLSTTRRPPTSPLFPYTTLFRSALYMQGLPELRASVLDCPAAVVHGWRDEVVPFEHSVRFAQAYRAALHLLESDHRLHNQIRVIQYLFEYFLIALDLPAIAFE